MPGRKKTTTTPTKKAAKKPTKRVRKSPSLSDKAKTLELIQKRLREEAELAFGTSAKTRGYTMSDAYEIGERIEHSNFGLGIVRGRVGDSKIEVVFQDKERTLVHQMSAA